MALAYQGPGAAVKKSTCCQWERFPPPVKWLLAGMLCCERLHREDGDILLPDPTLHERAVSIRMFNPSRS